ncbi:uncharacterized protein B0H64DRAFT_176440 [Chaetomium fimeti]|uniref:Uncharacterized protein n=1 Tax=Chaetomium fimeti TaxID=1854472 RepID=A0AAE0HCW9_9PEZI|nr:hypothetical protein B0H64DRAFT_176440 [Chaetomium fimeti]
MPRKEAACACTGSTAPTFFGRHRSLCPLAWFHLWHDIPQPNPSISLVRSCPSTLSTSSPSTTSDTSVGQRRPAHVKPHRRRARTRGISNQQPATSSRPVTKYFVPTPTFTPTLTPTPTSTSTPPTPPTHTTTYTYSPPDAVSRPARGFACRHSPRNARDAFIRLALLPI